MRPGVRGLTGTIHRLTNHSDLPTGTEDTPRDGNPINDAGGIVPASLRRWYRGTSISGIENQLDGVLDSDVAAAHITSISPNINSPFSFTANVAARNNIGSAIAGLDGTIELVSLSELKVYKASANTAGTFLSLLSSRTTDTPFHAAPDPNEILRSNPDIAHVIQALRRRALERQLDPELRAHGGGEQTRNILL